MRNQTTLMGGSEKTANAFAAPLAIVQRPMVHVHADEAVGQVHAHAPRELQRMRHRFGPVVEAKLDAHGQQIRNALSVRGGESFMNDVSAQRKRQSALRFLPPRAKIMTQHQAFISKRKLAFVNNK